MNFNITKYTLKNDNEWDDFVENNSLNGTIYHTRNFLNYHGNKFEDTSILIYLIDELIAVVPCCLINNINFSHKGATYGGPVITKKKLKVNVLNDLINEMFKYYNNNFECRLANDIYFKNPINLLYYFLGKKLNINLELSWYIETGINLIDYIENKRNKKMLTQIFKDTNMYFLSTENIEDYIEFYEILKKNLSMNHNNNPTHTLDEFLLIKKILKNNQELFIVKNLQLSKIVGGVFVIKVTKQCWYTFYISRNIDIQNSGISVIYIMDKISEIANKQKVKYLDYGISTEEAGQKINIGLSEFKNNSFGGKANYRYLLLKNK
jgi:hypothetical protein